MIGAVPEARDPRDPVWDFTDILLFFGLALPVFLVLFYIVLAALRIADVRALGLRVLLPQFVGYLGALIPLYAIFKLKYGESPMRLLRMGVTVREAAVSISLGILTAFAVTALAVLLRTPSISMPMEDLLSDTASLIAAAILGVTLGPAFEELLFRGLLQPVLSRYTGVILGIFLSALPFAMLHGPQYAWSWRHVLLITVAGVSFGVRRRLTNSTGAAAVMHAAYNAVLFAAFIAGRWAGPSLPRTF
jgi:membrane protease YdiL (CAAX protease family)